MLEVKNLSFSYGYTPVLKNVTLKASPGEVISVLGRNGAGKSTLFRCMLGMLTGYSGTVFLDGTDIRMLSVQALAGKMAFVPQSCDCAFNYRVADVVLMGVTPSLRALSSPGKEELRRADAAMERVGIRSLADRSFQHLSEGEKQLVLLARALAQQAELLILDEPVSSLDFANQFRILKEVRGLSREGYTVLQSIHDPEKAYQFSDRIIALKNGSVFAGGTPKEVLTAENIRQLYGLDTRMTTLFDDRVRIFTPDCIFHGYISEK